MLGGRASEWMTHVGSCWNVCTSVWETHFCVLYSHPLSGLQEIKKFWLNEHINPFQGKRIIEKFKVSEKKSQVSCFEIRSTLNLLFSITPKFLDSLVPIYWCRVYMVLIKCSNHWLFEKLWIQRLCICDLNKEFLVFTTYTNKSRMRFELSVPNILIPLFNNSHSYALFLLYYAIITLSNTSIKLYNPFPMAYGMCSERNMFMSWKMGRKYKVLLRDLRGIAVCLRGRDVTVHQALSIWIGVLLLTVNASLGGFYSDSGFVVVVFAFYCGGLHSLVSPVYHRTALTGKVCGGHIR